MNQADVIIGVTMGLVAVVVTLGITAALTWFTAPASDPSRRSWRRAGAAFAPSPDDWTSRFAARARIAVGATVLALMAAIIVTPTLPRRYSASATLFVGPTMADGSLDYSTILASQLVAPTYARLAQSAGVLGAAAADAGIDRPPAEVASMVEAAVDPGSVIVRINTATGDAEMAANLANAVAEQLLALAPAASSDPELAERISEIDAQLRDVRQRLVALLSADDPDSASQAEVDRLSLLATTLEAERSDLVAQTVPTGPGVLTIVERAEVPDEPAGPSRLVIGATATATAILGYLVVAALLRVRLTPGL